MTTFLNALVPVFLVIALGWGLRRIAFTESVFWAQAERATYFVLFPALLFRTLSTGTLSGPLIWPVVTVLLLSILAVSLIALVAARMRGLDGAATTSLLQGAIRGNAYVGIAAGAALYGSAGLELASLCVLVAVPTVNVISVLALTRNQGGMPFSALVPAVARNPLILACLAGGLANFLGAGLPFGVDRALDILGNAALPFGLLSVGAALSLSSSIRARTSLVLAGAMKLVLFPLIALAIAQALGVEGITRDVILLWAALPAATSAYILARQLGGDSTLMTGIIVTTTIGAVVTMPLLLSLG